MPVLASALAPAACAHQTPTAVRARVIATAQAEAGLPAPGAVDWVGTVLYRTRARPTATTAHPAAGDLVVFDPGERGIVTRTDPDGRVHFLFVKAGAVRAGVLSLRHPGLRRDRNGRLLNTYVKARRIDDPPGARYLAGELWSAFSVLDAAD